jgi:hypothetical protein
LNEKTPSEFLEGCSRICAETSLCLLRNLTVFFLEGASAPVGRDRKDVDGDVSRNYQDYRRVK